jgi:hypothetical protein
MAALSSKAVEDATLEEGFFAFERTERLRRKRRASARC